MIVAAHHNLPFEVKPNNSIGFIKDCTFIFYMSTVSVEK